MSPGRFLLAGVFIVVGLLWGTDHSLARANGPELFVLAEDGRCAAVAVSGSGFTPGSFVRLLVRTEHSDSSAELPGGRVTIDVNGMFELLVDPDWIALCDEGVRYEFIAASDVGGDLGLPLARVPFHDRVVPGPGSTGTGYGDTNSPQPPGFGWRLVMVVGLIAISAIGRRWGTRRAYRERRRTETLS